MPASSLLGSSASGSFIYHQSQAVRMNEGRNLSRFSLSEFPHTQIPCYKENMKSARRAWVFKGIERVGCGGNLSLSFSHAELHGGGWLKIQIPRHCLQRVWPHLGSRTSKHTFNTFPVGPTSLDLVRGGGDQTFADLKTTVASFLRSETGVKS